MNDGYAVELSKEEADSRSGHMSYLSHDGVINPNKSKVRMVYRAAAEYEGTSLDEKLLQGPQLNNSLTGVLFRLRKDVSSIFLSSSWMFKGEYRSLTSLLVEW